MSKLYKGYSPDKQMELHVFCESKSLQLLSEVPLYVMGLHSSLTLSNDHLTDESPSVWDTGGMTQRSGLRISTQKPL